MTSEIYRELRMRLGNLYGEVYYDDIVVAAHYDPKLQKMIAPAIKKDLVQLTIRFRDFVCENKDSLEKKELCQLCSNGYYAFTNLDRRELGRTDGKKVRIFPEAKKMAHFCLEILLATPSYMDEEQRPSSESIFEKILPSEEIFVSRFRSQAFQMHKYLCSYFKQTLSEEQRAHLKPVLATLSKKDRQAVYASLYLIGAYKVVSFKRFKWISTLPIENPEYRLEPNPLYFRRQYRLQNLFKFDINKVNRDELVHSLDSFASICDGGNGANLAYKAEY
jgi:hypothetical protein